MRRVEGGGGKGSSVSYRWLSLPQFERAAAATICRCNAQVCGNHTIFDGSFYSTVSCKR